MRLTKFLLLVNFLLLASLPTYAYDNNNVHPQINISAVNQSKLDTVFKNYLGFIDGLPTSFDGVEALEWFKQGGTDEDTPKSRTIFHFHDPLERWGDAGLYLGYSALVWAQRGTADYPYPNHYSWWAARDYFYSALTTGQEADYALTFRSIGQVMHLVSDMAVPAHVREDIHLSHDLLPEWANDRDPYEVWTASKDGLITLDSIGAFTGLPVNQSIFKNYVTNDSAPFPISALWDQNKYKLPDPDSAVTKTVEDIGLAEYTNANFF